MPMRDEMELFLVCQTSSGFMGGRRPYRPGADPIFLPMDPQADAGTSQT
jgi:hypothetical protein